MNKTMEGGRTYGIYNAAGNRNTEWLFKY